VATDLERAEAQQQAASRAELTRPAREAEATTHQLAVASLFDTEKVFSPMKLRVLCLNRDSHTFARHDRASHPNRLRALGDALRTGS
jgi:hypothetical protein